MPMNSFRMISAWFSDNSLAGLEEGNAVTGEADTHYIDANNED